MTKTTTQDDPYAGASQSAAEVAGRAAGSTKDDAPRAQSDGYYTDPADGVRRKIRAGDPVPVGVELDGTKAEPAPAEDKSRKSGENK